MISRQDLRDGRTKEQGESIMPIYEFQCRNCKKDFEKLVFAGEEKDITCPECLGKDIAKKMSAASFMGSGMGKCIAKGPKGFS